MLRSVSYQFFNLTELKSDHIKKMDSRFVKKAAGYVYIACPNWILQFTPIHFYVS